MKKRLRSPRPGSSKLAFAGKAALSLLTLAAMGGHSYAQLLRLGVNFIGRPNDGEAITWGLGVDDLAGVDPQRDWNNLGNNLPGEPAGNFAFGGDGTLTSTPLFSDDGVLGSRGTSLITATIHANDSWNSDGPVATPNDKLMQGIIKHAFNTANPPITMTLNGLTVGTNYKLIAYTPMNSGAGNVSQGDYVVSGAGVYDTYYIFNENSFDGTFSRGVNTVNDLASRTTDTDYVQWDSVAPNGSGALTLTINWRGGSDGTALGGFQLVELPPLPGADKYWNVGAGAGTWDLVTQNWRTDDDPGPSNATFSAASNDVANFTNLGTAGARTVNVVAGGVSAGGISVNSTAGNDYTIQGGPIRGLGAVLTKDGTSTLTMTGANEYAGDTIILHGTVNATTIGDSAGAGNLGKGAGITLGAPAGASDARLFYGGATASVGRGVTMGTRGGQINITVAGTTLTFTRGLSGAGTLTKAGPGSLEFSSTTEGVFTGGLTVTGGKLSLKRLGFATSAVNISGGGALEYGGASLDDGRVVTIGTGGGSISVTDPNARLRFGTLNASAGALAVSGSGRLMVNGVASFGTAPGTAVMPTIANGGTLALTNPAATNILPTVLSIPSGTLELAPSAFPGVTSINLTGGTLRLGQDSLQAEYFSGLGNDVQGSLSGSADAVNDYFDAIGAPTLATRTNVGGRTNLDFNNTNGGAAAPFADQGFADIDNIRARFKGKILITAAGPTRFATTSDDGSAIFIDGVRVVNNNFFQGMTQREGTVDLTTGLHDIVMYFYEGGGGAGLIASYQPVGATALAPIPNNIVYAGEVNTSATALPIFVTANSMLQIAAGSAQLSALDVAGGNIFAVEGTGKFTGTTLSGAGVYGVDVRGRNSTVNLGPINGTGKTINKVGTGALVFSNPAPANLTVNANAGLVVMQGSEDAGTTTNPLGQSTVVLNGGGIGFSASLGNPTYTTNLTPGTNSYRIEAGRFGSDLVTTTITWQPANGTFAIANTATATVASRTTGYSLTVAPPVTGQGALVLEQGNLSFTAPGGLTNTGGVTIQGASTSIVGPISTSAFSVTGNALGVTNDPLVTVGGALTASSVNVARGNVSITGQTTNSGAFTQSGGTMNLNANSTHASVAVTGGTLAANGNLTTSGAFNVSGGTTTVAGVASVGSLTVSGGTTQFQSTLTAPTVAVTGGSLAVGTLSAPGGISVTGVGTFLNLNPTTAGTVTGNIALTGQGTVRAQSGVTDMGQATISVSPRVFQAGLLEGLLTNIFDLNNGNPGMTLPNPGTGRPGTGGIQLSPRMGETNQKDATHWGDNEAWVYSGQIFDADGVFTFGENIDDRVRVVVDGVTALSSDAWDVPTSSGTTASFGMGPEQNGWHNIEIRLQNGGGGAGTVVASGWGGGDNANYLNKGLGLNNGATQSTNGVDYVIPVDPGDMTLFRTVTEGGGIVAVESSATLRTGGITRAQAITLAGAFTTAELQLNNHASATASSADNLIVSGFAAAPTPQGRLVLGDNNVLTVGTIRVLDDTGLTIAKADGATTGGTLRVDGLVTGSSGILGSSMGAGFINVENTRVILNTTLSGTGTVTASTGAVIGGTGNIAGTLAATAGGTIAPGDGGIGLLTAGTLALTGGKLQLQISSTTSYDALTVSTGGVNLTGSTLEGLLTNFTMTPGQVLYIINNMGAGPVIGAFAGAPDGSNISFGGQSFQISYDAIFNGAFDTGGNDVALRLVPEPGALSTLLGGLGMLCGLQRFRRRRAA